MKYLWSYIEEKNWTAEKKRRAAMQLLALFYGLAGLALWLIVRSWALSSWDWMVCFIGYPVMLSIPVFFLYFGSNPFHNGSRK